MPYEIPIEFDPTRIYALAKSVWGLEQRRITNVDRLYCESDDEVDEDFALPCLEVQVTPFGVFLTGNGVVPEHLEIWADGYNPMDEPDAERLAEKILEDFGRVEDSLSIHISFQPVEGMELRVCFVPEEDTYISCLDNAKVIATLMEEQSGDDRYADWGKPKFGEADDDDDEEV